MREKPLILIVDDESDFLEIASMKLTASGFEISLAHNADEGVAAAQTLHPDLILMDIHMPGDTGTDAALRIKQDQATKDIKIAFLSSLRDPWPKTKGDRNEIAKEIGLDDFIDKGSDLDVIVAKVKELLAR